MIRSFLMPLVASVAACVGCATMLGIDQNYSPVEQGDASSSGGDVAAGTGGVIFHGSGGSGAVAAGGAAHHADAGSGGVIASGGTPVIEGGVCTATSCGAGEKCCPKYSAVCIPDQADQPITGCGAPGCDPCPVPANGVAVCNNGACEVRCNEAYQLKAGNCVLINTGTGGVGGATGTGGKGSGGARMCDVNSCPVCNIAGPIKCCRNDQTCGCSWAPTFACY